MSASVTTRTGASAPPAANHRADLDGLRGIAIGLVVIFHVFVGRVSGGVDVFLLLSGYFFLGSQLRYAVRPNASLNPWWPIWRVLRRLVPTLAVVLGVTMLGVWLLTPELFNTELTRQVTASLGYFLNWELISQEAEYAAASVDTSPLQHLWSMSVQGQFYLLAIAFALILAWVARSRHWGAEDVNRVAGPILIAVTVLSFLWAARHGLVGTPGSYYSIFSRTWELTLGAVLALYQHKLRLPKIFSPIGLVMIVITGIVIPHTFAFPGPAALLPIGGAVFIILAGADNTGGAILSSRPALWLGRNAYALYVWHWPLLIILTVLSGRETPSFLLGVVVVAVSLVLADLTNRYVEAPLRQRRRRPTSSDKPVEAALASLRTVPGRTRAIGGVAVAALVAALLAIQPGYAAVVANADDKLLDPQRYPGVMAHFGAEVPDVRVQPNPSVVASIYPAPGDDACMVFLPQPADHFATETRDGDPCIYGDQNAEEVVVIAGGSHAEPWTETLDLLGKQHGFAVVPFLRQECPIVFGPNYGVSPECEAWSAAAIERMVDLDPAAVVSTSTRPQDPMGLGPDIVPQGYDGFWAALDHAQIPFIGLRDNPWSFTRDFQPMDANYCLVDLGIDNWEDCSMNRTDVYAEVDPAQIALSRYELATSVDTSDWFCLAELCPPIIGNIPVYRDQNHISNAYARSTAPLLWDVLGPWVTR